MKLLPVINIKSTRMAFDSKCEQFEDETKQMIHSLVHMNFFFIDCLKSSDNVTSVLNKVWKQSG